MIFHSASSSHSFGLSTRPLSFHSSMEMRLKGFAHMLSSSDMRYIYIILYKLAFIRTRTSPLCKRTPISMPNRIQFAAEMNREESRGIGRESVGIEASSHCAALETSSPPPPPAPITNRMAMAAIISTHAQLPIISCIYLSCHLVIQLSSHPCARFHARFLPSAL